MRIEPLSNCERNFILESFNEGKIRIDGRRSDEYRDVKVIVGRDLGTCLATLGKTKVFAQVSCSVVEPKAGVRGNMGHVEVQVDMSPMGSPSHEEGRLGSQGVELTRVLETLLRDCGVIDLEGLCVRTDKQVWQIRVDVHVLDSDGGLADCASTAALTALVHFRKPDATVLADSIIIHSADQKMPVPLNIYHLPICVTFGITFDGRIIYDPIAREELCLRGAFVVAANKRHEICTLHQCGNLVLQEEVIIKCIDFAIQRACDISELISSVIADDNVKRSERKSMPGFASLISLDVLTSNECNPNELIAPAILSNAVPMETNAETAVITETGVVHIGEETSSGMWVERRNQEDLEVLEQVNEIVETHAVKSTLNAIEDAAQMEMEEVNDFLDSIEQDLVVPSPVTTTRATESVSKVTPASGEPIQLSLALKKKK